MTRKNQTLLVAASLVVFALVIALLLSTGTPAKAPTPTAVAIIATPTGARPACGTAALQNGSSVFPVINTVNCPPDRSSLPKKPWNMINVREPLAGLAATTCEDWYAYHTNQTGNWEIFRWNKNTAAVNLSRGGAETNNVSPALSPDRQNVAFSTDRDGNWEVYVTTANGSGEPQRLTYNTFAVDMAPLWSPDGKRLVYDSIRNGNWDLFVFDVVSGEELQLTDNPANDLFPTWQNDTTIIYQSNQGGRSQIYAINLDDYKLRTLSDGKGEDSDPVLSADGKQMAFISVRDGSKNPVLYMMAADGGSPTALTTPDMAVGNQSFAPNNTLIAFEGVKGDGKSSVYVYDLNQKSMRQVTDSTVASYAPTWDCGSSTLVFTANLSNPNLFSAPALPLTAPPVNVPKDATPMTAGAASSQFPMGSPRMESASKRSITTSLTAGG